MSVRAGDAAVIVGVGALCPVGSGIRQVDASVRAGLGAQAESSVMNRWGEPMTLALVPEEALAPLEVSLEAEPWTAAHRRVLRLAAPAFLEALAALPDQGASVSLYVGLPEPRPNALPLAAPGFTRALFTRAKAALELSDARLFEAGRAAALMAFEAGVRCLHEGRSEWVMVGGADTCMDLARLDELDAEGRLLGPRVMDGFVPGEGAAFALLTTFRNAQRYSLDPAVSVLGVGTALDPGHLYAAEPARGEGLSECIEALLRQTGSPSGAIQSVYAGFNGESFGAKEWGVARLRHHGLFAPDALIHHPADCHGDLGAATGAMLTVLAEAALRRGDRAGPVLVFSSSDREQRAASLLTRC